MKLLHLSLLFFLSFVVSDQAAAADLNSGDTAWLLTSAVLVLFMTLPGLALFYSGLVRSKNVLSVIMQCFSIACLSSILWILFVYGLAFGDGEGLNAIIGKGKFLLSGITSSDNVGTIPETVFIMFQMTFAIITPALIIGSFAERMKFSAVLSFSGLWLVLVYAPVCHWVWGGGWLAELGFLDFAGGAVVHINAGVAALVAAMVVGNRMGFGVSNILPHSMVITGIGAAMLWVGWFGFNAGSALAAGSGAGMAMLVTHIAAAAGALTWTVCEWIKYRTPSLLGLVTGLIAGLGTITPASGYVGPMGALALGVIAGLCCYTATHYIKQKLKIDDSLDVFSVHAVGGIIGTFLVAVFATKAMGGIGLENSMTDQMLIQGIGIVAVMLWCGVMTFVLLKALDAVLGLRVSKDDEIEGLDLVSHNERGYNL